LERAEEGQGDEENVYKGGEEEKRERMYIRKLNRGWGEGKAAREGARGRKSKE